MGKTTKIVLIVWAIALVAAGAWIAQDSLLKNDPTITVEQRGFLFKGVVNGQILAER